MTVITVLFTRYYWGQLKGWACGMYGTEGFGKASRIWSYHLHATSVEITDAEIVSLLHSMFFFMLLCLIKTSQLHLLVLVLPSKQTTFTFNLAVQIKLQQQLLKTVLTHTEIQNLTFLFIFSYHFQILHPLKLSTCKISNCTHV